MKHRLLKSQRHAPLLACWAFDNAAALHAAVENLHAEPVELLPISTCQRHELFVFSGQWLELPASAKLIGQQADAASRLFRLTAGALSDVPGECAVELQVRIAMRRAVRQGIAGPLLAKLVRRAIEAGRTTRARAEQTASILELSDLVVPVAAACRVVVLLGTGALAKSVHASLVNAGIEIKAWGTRRPRRDRGASLSIAEAIRSLSAGDAVISTLAQSPDLIPIDQLPQNVVAIDLSQPSSICGSGSAQWTLQSIIQHAQRRLAPQVDAIRRAAHRLPALAQAALAEAISPPIATMARTIVDFREAIVNAEFDRLESTLTQVSPDQAEQIRRAIRHAAARSVHPIHDYVNALGRQGRADEAQTIIDHLLGSRVGWGSTDQTSAPVDHTPVSHS